MHLHNSLQRSDMFIATTPHLPPPDSKGVEHYHLHCYQNTICSRQHAPKTSLNINKPAGRETGKVPSKSYRLLFTFRWLQPNNQTSNSLQRSDMFIATTPSSTTRLQRSRTLPSALLSKYNLLPSARPKNIFKYKQTSGASDG